MKRVSVDSDNWNFVREDGEAFIPFGTNYHDQDAGTPPRTWEVYTPDRFKRHMDMIAGLGGNVVRIFLPAQTLMPSVGRIVEREFEKTDSMLEIAGARDIYIVFSGPDGLEGIPEYWKDTRVSYETGEPTGEPALDRFSTDANLEALDAFWAFTAKRYASSAAVMAWSLMNEPIVCWNSRSMFDKWNRWLRERYGTRAALQGAGFELGGAERLGAVLIPAEDAPADGRLWEYQLFREHIANEWTRRQVQVIRKHDGRRLITNGLIQWSLPLMRPEWHPTVEELGWFVPLFPRMKKSPGWYSAFHPERQKEYLDYMSVHFYPDRVQPFAGGHSFRDGLTYLKMVVDYCRVGMPLVLEEFGWAGGGSMSQEGPAFTEKQQAEWNAAVVEETLSLVSGWIPWGFADCPHLKGLASLEGLFTFDERPKEWAGVFKELAGRIGRAGKLASSDAGHCPQFDFREAVTAGKQEYTVFEEALREARART